MNQGLLSELRVLEKYYKRTKDTHREQAYQRTAAVVTKWPHEITTDDLPELKKRKGIGKASLTKIKQFIDSGSIPKATELKAEMAAKGHKNTEFDVKDQLMDVWGVGAAKANSLWDAGIRSITDLRKDPSLLNRSQKIGLKYFDDLNKRVPKKYIRILSLAMQYTLAQQYGIDSFKFVVGGSYRRGDPTSRDMDCVLFSTVFTPADAIATLKEAGFITDTLSFKDTKFMGIAHCLQPGAQSIRLDIAFPTVDEEGRDNFGAMILYFTGSKGLNTEMRLKAKESGMLLNEYGLWKGSTMKAANRIDAYTEEEIFKALGYDYIAPNLR